VEAYQKFLALAPSENIKQIELAKQRLTALGRVSTPRGTNETIVKSWLESDIPISKQERTIAKTFSEILDAYNNKDFAKLTTWDARATKDTESSFNEMLSKSRNFKLHLVEVLAYNNEIIRGRAIYSCEILDPTKPGRNLNVSQTNISLANINDRWILIEASTYKPNNDSMEKLGEIIGAMEKAKKRYGIDDISKWQELNM
jgi:hypothetical protein